MPKELYKVKSILRLAKVVGLGREPAIAGPDKFQYFALLEGGHRTNVDNETASEIAAFLDSANRSDAAFFKRGT